MGLAYQLTGREWKRCPEGMALTAGSSADHSADTLIIVSYTRLSVQLSDEVIRWLLGRV